MIKIKNKIIPFGTYRAMFLFGFLFYKGELSEKTERHERIHSKQYWECVLLFSPLLLLSLKLLGVVLCSFYIWYLVEFFLNLKKLGWACAYRNVRFEKEAYKNDGDENYFKNRKLFNWLCAD